MQPVAPTFGRAHAAAGSNSALSMSSISATAAVKPGSYPAGAQAGAIPSVRSMHGAMLACMQGKLAAVQNFSPLLLAQHAACMTRSQCLLDLLTAFAGSIAPLLPLLSSTGLPGLCPVCHLKHDDRCCICACISPDSLCWLSCTAATSSSSAHCLYAADFSVQDVISL